MFQPTRKEQNNEETKEVVMGDGLCPDGCPEYGWGCRGGDAGRHEGISPEYCGQDGLAADDHECPRIIKKAGLSGREGRRLLIGDLNERESVLFTRTHHSKRYEWRRK
jgi:hypothetical protein